VAVSEQGLDCQAVDFQQGLDGAPRPLEVSYCVNTFRGPLADVFAMFIPAEVAGEGDSECLKRSHARENGSFVVN